MHHALRTALVFALSASCATPSKPAPPGAPPATATPVEPDVAPVPAPTGADRAAAKAAYDEGFDLAVAGDYDGALARFRRASDLDPSDPVTWFDLGGLYESMGRKTQALEAMRQAIKVQPRFVQARIEMSSLIVEVSDDPQAALAELRRALTTVDPFVIERYPLERTRGEALHKAATQFGMLGFPGATAAIEASLLAHPTATPHRKSAQVGEMATRSLDDDAARPAAFDAARARARDEAKIGRLDHAADALAEAAETARRLPLDRWLDTTALQVEIALRRGALDDAAAHLDELAWLEYLTEYAPKPIGGRARARRILTAPGGEALRDHPVVVATRRQLGLP